MEQQSQVHNVEIEFDGKAHRATYFVENQIIHANVAGRLIMSPLGTVPAAETVKTLLMGQLLQSRRKQGQSQRWKQQETGPVL